MGWKDRAEVVKPSWKDRAEPVAVEQEQADFWEKVDSRAKSQPATMQDDIARISSKYGVDPEWLKSRQIGMGYVDEKDQIDLMGGGAGDKFQGVINSISAGANSVLGEGLLGGLPTWINKKLSSDEEASAIDELRSAVDSRKGVMAQIREGVLSGNPAVAASKAIGVGSKLAKAGQVAFGLSEGARAGLMESNEGDELKDVATGASIAGAFEAIPYVGKAAGQVKRLMPGTSKALPIVNRATASAASMVPWQNATKDEIYTLLDNPEMRRKLLKTNLLDETEKLTSTLDSAKDSMSKSVGDAYEQGQKLFTDVEGTLKESNVDFTAMNKWVSELKAISDKVDENSTFFSSTPKKIIGNISKILSSGGPNKIGGIKARMLASRRHLDDIMKHKNWDNLSTDDQGVIKTIRQSLDNTLKNKVSNGSELASVDDLYSGYMDDVGSFFKGVSKRGEDGVDLSKLFNDVRSGSARGRKFDDSIGAMDRFFRKNSDKLDPSTMNVSRDVKKSLNSVRELGSMRGLQESLTRSGGGPTSQGVNWIAQGAAANMSGGLSLAGLPITNTAGYTNILDKMSGLPEKFQRALQAAQGRGGNAVAVTHFLLGQSDPEYQKHMRDDDE